MDAAPGDAEPPGVSGGAWVCVVCPLRHERAFFGGDTPIRIQTIAATGVGGSIRTYDKFNDIEKEILDARVFGGMHFRHSCMNGAQLGRKVAKNLVDNFFRPTNVVAR